jgi:hypothetical protein
MDVNYIFIGFSERFLLQKAVNFRLQKYPKPLFVTVYCEHAI